MINNNNYFNRSVKGGGNLIIGAAFYIVGGGGGGGRPPPPPNAMVDPPLSITTDEATKLHFSIAHVSLHTFTLVMFRIIHNPDCVIVSFIMHNDKFTGKCLIVK